MSRDLNLDVNRSQKEMKDLSNRLDHKKNCRTGKTRVYNKIQAGIEKAYELLRNNELESVCNEKLVTDRKELEEYLNLVNDELVIDMETTGLSVMQDMVVGACLYAPNEYDKSIYVPLNHTDIKNNRLDGQMDEEVVKGMLKPVLESNKVKVINHNLKYDAKVIKFNWGIDIKNIYWDTMIASHLLNENEPHGLKPLYKKYVNKDASEKDYGDYFGNNFPFNYIPLEVAKVYGANDPYKTYKLYQFQKKYIKMDHDRADFRKISHVFHNIEMELLPLLIDMELRGVEIRDDFAEELRERMVKMVDKTEEEMDEILKPIKDLILDHEELERLSDNGKINYNSYDQLKYLFYEVLNLKPFRKYKRNKGWVDNLSTGEEILVKLKERESKQKDLVRFIDLLLKYREIKKLLGTYVEKIPKVVEEKTGAVHTNFNQIGTVTGRFSSSHPVYRINLQNIPARSKLGKEIRKMFKPREGYYMISSDYSQIEPRTLASISGDKEMKKAYKEGKDLYAQMGSRIFNVPYEDCLEFHPETGEYQPEGDKRRSQVKSVLLGIMYERGAKAIGEQFGESERWGQKLVDNFLKSYPAVEKTRRKVIHQAETLGYVNTVDGRKRRLPNMQLDNKDNYKYQLAHRQCLNSVIQGTAGDIMKKAMIKVYEDERLQELGAKLLMTIHDEMIMECPKENIKEIVEYVEADMKKVGEDLLDMPMKVDTEITNYWYGDDLSEEVL